MRGRKDGFTLIELLVVISIIAILAAILFPVFAKARERAKQNTCLSNMKQTALGFIMYSTDQDDKLPFAVIGLNNAWHGPVLPYISNTRLMECPSGNGEGAASMYPDYGMNWWAGNCDTDRVRFPSELLMLTEASTAFVWQSNNTDPFGVGPIAANWKAGNRPFTPKAHHFVSAGGNLVGGTVNCAYVDGHVKAQDVSALQFEGGYDVLQTMMYHDRLPNYYLWVPVG